jgi:hypothetical protein
VQALAAELPAATVHGIAAGLHVTVRLPGAYDEEDLRAAARSRRLELSTLSDYRPGAFASDPTLLVGYAQLVEPSAARSEREPPGSFPTACPGGVDRDGAERCHHRRQETVVNGAVRATVDAVRLSSQPRGLLRRQPEPSRLGPRERVRARDHPLARAGRGLELVLRR